MKNEQKQPEKCPEFKPEAFWAFCSIMLFKIGGVEALTQKQIDDFSMIDDGPEVVYNHDKKVWIMQLPKKDRPTIVTVPKKLLKRNRRPIFS